MQNSSTTVMGSVDYPSRSKAWLSAFIIFIVAAIAMADRLAISILLGPIKAEFGIGDFQAGLLVGAAFASFYIIALLPIGWAADRFSRKKVLFCCLAVWTLASIACGYATGFLMLFLCRMFVGAGEAGIGPVGYGVIGSNFRREEIAKPIALFNVGFSGGAALGVAAAGAILAAGSQGAFKGVPIIGELSPWRIAFILIGLPGLFALLLVPLIHDQSEVRPAKKSTEPILPHLRSNKTLWLLYFLSASCASVGFLSVTSWGPELLNRNYQVSFGKAGAAFGGVMLTAGLIAPLVYSTIVDWLSKRGVLDSTIRVGLIPLVLSLPLSYLTLTAPNEASFMVYLLLLLITLAMLGPMNFTLLQQLTPPAIRSRLTSILILLITIMGLGIGTSLVGALSEFVFGEDKLHLALLVTIVVFHFVGLIGYLILRPKVIQTLGQQN